MTLRCRFAMVMLIWVCYGVLDVWVVVHHWITASVLVGFFGTIGCTSVAHKLITGAWPPWGKVWRLFTTRRIDD